MIASIKSGGWQVSVEVDASEPNVRRAKVIEARRKGETVSGFDFAQQVGADGVADVCSRAIAASYRS
jgi:hypothetical protein